MLVYLFLTITIPILTFLVLPYIGTHDKVFSGASVFPSSIRPFTKKTIGPAPMYHPWITNVQIVDLDRDGITDVIACDARLNTVFWYRQSPLGQWSERVLAKDMIAPAHATVVDLDKDGDLDVIVSILGNIWPDDGVIGRVVLLENINSDQFVPHVLLDDVRRVADVQAGDLDNDGDLDLAVAVFGHSHGQTLWLENRGRWSFTEHELLALPGTIHVPLADFDRDGDLDIVTIVSQDEEELWGFENLGGGKFRPRRLYFTFNFDLGSGGLVQADLDNDGDMDLLLAAGDNFEDVYSYPQPYHGCIWFENRGGWEFVPRRIATFGGTYAVAVGDLDRDGDNDVVLVSMVNEWDKPGHASIVWLENDGHQNFRTWQIDDSPTHLVTVACGDLNGDKTMDIVAGGLHTTPPYDRLGRVTCWMNNNGKR